MSDGETIRTARDKSLLREVRSRLSKEKELAGRLRRLERMESAARMWVNGKEIGGDPRYRHLSNVHD
jgi:hypothetical protein